MGILSGVDLDILEITQKITVTKFNIKIINNMKTYLMGLREFLVSNPEKVNTHHVELQDNSYGGNPSKYTSVVQNGFATNYHPNLFSMKLKDFSLYGLIPRAFRIAFAIFIIWLFV